MSQPAYLFNSPSRRWKCLNVPLDLWLNMIFNPLLQQGPDGPEITVMILKGNGNIPNDVKVCAATIDNLNLMVRVKLWSQEFDEVPDGCLIPDFILFGEWQRYKITEPPNHSHSLPGKAEVIPAPTTSRLYNCCATASEHAGDVLGMHDCCKQAMPDTINVTIKNVGTSKSVCEVRHDTYPVDPEIKGTLAEYCYHGEVRSPQNDSLFQKLLQSTPEEGFLDYLCLPHDPDTCFICMTYKKWNVSKELEFGHTAPHTEVVKKPPVEMDYKKVEFSHDKAVLPAALQAAIAAPIPRMIAPKLPGKPPAVQISENEYCYHESVTVVSRMFFRNTVKEWDCKKCFSRWHERNGNFTAVELPVLPMLSSLSNCRCCLPEDDAGGLQVPDLEGTIEVPIKWAPGAQEVIAGINRVNPATGLPFEFEGLPVLLNSDISPINLPTMQNTIEGLDGLNDTPVENIEVLLATVDEETVVSSKVKELKEKMNLKKPEQPAKKNYWEA